MYCRMKALVGHRFLLLDFESLFPFPALESRPYLTGFRRVQQVSIPPIILVETDSTLITGIQM